MKPSDALKEQVLHAARKLFMAKGFEAVGMRDIAKAVNRQPMQIYRLKLGKSEILAELIIRLNEEQIGQLPALVKQIESADLLERVCCYLAALYELDIQSKPIRSVGAAFGWTWSEHHEQRVVEQVHRLVAPVAEWMQAAGLDDIPARCIGIWSLYYVGYRKAVINSATAQDCLASIKPSLRYYLSETRPDSGS